MHDIWWLRVHMELRYSNDAPTNGTAIVDAAAAANASSRSLEIHPYSFCFPALYTFSIWLRNCFTTAWRFILSVSVKRPLSGVLQKKHNGWLMECMENEGTVLKQLTTRLGTG
jgi:hypothetical protein